MREHECISEPRTTHHKTENVMTYSNCDERAGAQVLAHVKLTITVSITLCPENQMGNQEEAEGHVSSCEKHETSSKARRQASLEIGNRLPSMSVT
jgi:hypothetical protein